MGAASEEHGLLVLPTVQSLVLGASDGWVVGVEVAPSSKCEANLLIHDRLGRGDSPQRDPPRASFHALGLARVRTCVQLCLVFFPTRRPSKSHRRRYLPTYILTYLPTSYHHHHHLFLFAPLVSNPQARTRLTPSLLSFPIPAVSRGTTRPVASTFFAHAFAFHQHRTGLETLRLALAASPSTFIILPTPVRRCCCCCTRQ